MQVSARFLIVGFLAVATAATSTVGQSLPWTLVGETAQQMLFVNYETLVVNGAVRQAWMLTNATVPSSPGAPSLRTLREFDCSRGRYRNLQVIRYDGIMGRGSITSMDKEPTPWLPAIAGGAAEHALQNVCRR